MQRRFAFATFGVTKQEQFNRPADDQKLLDLLSNLLYCLCLLSSLACTVLLLRGYRRTGMRLLLWSGICFIFLSASNAVLLLEVEQADPGLHAYRLGLGLLAGIVLLAGFIWEAR